LALEILSSTILKTYFIILHTFTHEENTRKIISFGFVTLARKSSSQGYQVAKQLWLLVLYGGWLFNSQAFQVSA
jgi:hypothetical protein